MVQMARWFARSALTCYCWTIINPWSGAARRHGKVIVSVLKVLLRSLSVTSNVSGLKEAEAQNTVMSTIKVMGLLLLYSRQRLRF